jgi:two-component system cell cycle response regulator DivK
VSQRVIVVEDDLLNRMLFTTWLEDRACVVHEFGDGRDVCEKARHVEPDLFVIDICLPEVSGVELIEQLRSDSAFERIPVLAVTGYAAKEDESRIRSAGACAYLRKPVRQKDFNLAVDRLLASRPAVIAA